MLGFVEHKFKTKTMGHQSLYLAQVFAAIPPKQKDMITTHREPVSKEKRKNLKNLYEKMFFNTILVSVSGTRSGSAKLDDSLVLLSPRDPAAGTW